MLEDLRAQIRDGVLGPGARVPSRNGIIARYGVGEASQIVLPADRFRLRYRTSMTGPGATGAA